MSTLILLLLACGGEPAAEPEPAPEPVSEEGTADEDPRAWGEPQTIHGLVGKHYVMAGPLYQQPYIIEDGDQKWELTLDEQLNDEMLFEDDDTLHWFVAFTSTEGEKVVVDYTVERFGASGDIEVTDTAVYEVDGEARYSWDAAGEGHVRSE